MTKGKNNKKPISGYHSFKEGNPVPWKSKKQDVFLDQVLKQSVEP